MVDDSWSMLKHIRVNGRNLEQQIAFAQHVMSYQPEIGKRVFKNVFTIDFLKTDAAAVLKSKLLRH